MTDNDACDELLLDNQLCFALYSTSLLITKTYKPLLKALNLTYPQYLAMLALWEQDGITVSAVSKRLLTDPGSISPLLKRLASEGLIIRRRRKDDERVVELFLTDKGRALKEQAREMPACIIRASGHSLDDLMALKEQLISLRDQLEVSTRQ